MKKLPKILYIVGLTRAWAIENRARQLAVKLSNEFEVTIVHKGELPEDPSPFDVVHLHTPCMLPEIAKRGAYIEHPCWGFEIISERSNGQLPRLAKITPWASFCVVKNRRLGVEIAPYLAGSVKPIWIPNGVDERMFFPRELRVGWCGNHRADSLEYKGVEIVKKAVLTLAHAWRGQLPVVFVMDPGDAPKRILSQGEIAPWYRGLDCFCLASKGEGCSNTILEALASGVPVVTTDTGIAPELAADCDLRIVPRSVEGFVEGIRAVLEPIVRRREIISWSYKWKGIAERYAQLYRKLLAGGEK